MKKPIFPAETSWLRKDMRNELRFDLLSCRNGRASILLHAALAGLEDAHTHDEPSMEFGSDAHEGLPEEVLAAIKNGATPLAAVRVWKGMSVDQLARLSSVSATVITGAECGRGLSPEDQVKLAFVLGVGADLFYE